LGEIVLKSAPSTAVAYVTRKGPYDQIPEAVGEIFLWMRENGYEPDGPPIGVFFTSPFGVPPEELRWEMQIPLKPASAEDLEPTDTAPGIKTVPARTVVSTVHEGSYETVAATYQTLFAWLAARGFRMAGPPEEVYLTDPSNTPPEKMRTEIRFPVVKKEH